MQSIGKIKLFAFDIKVVDSIKDLCCFPVTFACHSGIMNEWQANVFAVMLTYTHSSLITH